MRAALVVLLAAVAAVALDARQGLDWAALADPVEVRGARVVAGSLALLALAAGARSVLQRLRRPRPPVDDSETEPEGEPFPLLLRVLATLLCAAAVALAWWVVTQVTGAVPDAAPTPTPTPTPDPGSADGSGATPGRSLLLGLAAALLLAGAVAALALRRTAAVPADDEVPEPAADAAGLTMAVRAAEEGLAGHDDARAAIVAAYTAMAASVTAGLARRGAGARASDTASELLERAVTAGLVGEGPAGELTALFREARFSRHPMGPAHRAAAERALAAVRAELVTRHG